MAGGEEGAKSDAAPAEPSPKKRGPTLGAIGSIAYAVVLAILGIVVLFILVARSR